jgi:hypothetical protein
MSSVQNLYKYEDSISDEKRKNLGIVYTPQQIVQHINDYVLSIWESDIPPKVCDFSCGTGVFLVDIAAKISKRYKLPLDIVYQDFIFANDVDKDATDIFRSFTNCPNITNIDGLEYELESFDIIVSNPPYIKIQNLDTKTREKVRQFSWCSKGNTDIYIAMCQKIISSRKIYGIICPNSWIRSGTGKVMKTEFFNGRTASHFVDFRNKKVFKAGAYTCIMLGSGEPKDELTFSTDFGADEETTTYKSLSKDNFYLTSSEKLTIKENNKNNTRLLDEVELKVGLATLADKVYFLPDCTEDDEWVYSKGLKFEKGACKTCFKASSLKRYSQDTKDYIIYPYNEDRSIFSESFFESQYPNTYAYLSSNKSKLLSRDKGKFQKKCEAGRAVWFEYGRGQGLNLKDEKILVSPILTKKSFMKISHGLFISGYCFQAKQGSDMEIDQILEVVESPKFKSWIRIFGDPKQGNYYSIKTATLTGFRYDKNYC